MGKKAFEDVSTLRKHIFYHELTDQSAFLANMAQKLVYADAASCR